MKKQTGLICSLSLIAAGALGTGQAWADTGKLLLTGGVSTVEGPAGGGITPWAVIGSNATAGEVGGSVSVSRLKTQDYGLTSYGAALGFKERLELSVGEQDFNASPAVALNGLGFSVANGQHIKMTVLGAKVRVAGDAVLDSDSLMPQIAVGMEYKSTAAGTIRPVLDFLHAKTTGTDLYASATKLFLAQGVLLNATLRYTNANQGGLLGFGSAAPGRDSRSLQPEFSLAYLLSKNVVVGAEYRFMPNNLEALGRAAGLGSALHQDNWKDLFVAWAPSKNVSITAAYVDLGQVVPGVTGNRRQSGLFLSTQIAF